VISRLSPCFAWELRILLSSILGEQNLLGFAIFSWTDVEALFLRVDVTLFLAGGHKALYRLT
jgi:hypothetical protein